MIGLVSGRSYSELKGVLEMLVRRISHAATLEVRPSDNLQFAAGRAAEVVLNGKLWGWLGELDRKVTDKLDLRDAVTVFEVDLQALETAAQLTPTFAPLPQFPPVERDLNFVLDEQVDWQQLEQVVRQSAGQLVDSITFGGQYRGKQIPADKKSYVVRVCYRAPDRTLTPEEVDRDEKSVIAACDTTLGAALR